MEERKHKRFKLKERLHVLDAKSSKLIGNMVDISEGGFKMITLNKIEGGEEFPLRIALPSTNGEKKVINVKARVQWCLKDDKHELSTLGCYIVQVDISDRAFLTDFISQQNFE
jgi:c-di-GMP-binding flagellar brake protein YcgR